eukprot:GHVR01091570.1.p1 GENE.GHVR01091570.1~~GHVR01091570.1.p1  ORF type:complete len:431 (-),score=76.49 GHVR01091570.1:85-1377(-)
MLSRVKWAQALSGAKWLGSLTNLTSRFTTPVPNDNSHLSYRFIDTGSVKVPMNVPLFQEVVQSHTDLDGQWRVSQLPSGLRVATCDKGGLVSSLGLFVAAGSRHGNVCGRSICVSHMLENLAWKANRGAHHSQMIKAAQDVQAIVKCTSSREIMMYAVDVCRSHIDVVLPLIVSNVKDPYYDDIDIQNAIRDIGMMEAKNESQPEVMLTELVHQAAYPDNTLGLPQFCTPDIAMKHMTNDVLKEFVRQHYRNDRMVFAGVNTDHDVLCHTLNTLMTPREFPKTEEGKVCVYKGGDARREGPGDMTHIALAYEYGGWNSEDLVPLSVMQSILGGGGAFSSGGPGKGVHSRLCTQVMNRHSYVENSVCFNQSYSDSGLFGIYLSGLPQVLIFIYLFILLLLLLLLFIFSLGRWLCFCVVGHKITWRYVCLNY